MHIPLFGFSKDFSDCFRLLALHPELFSCVVISCLATAAKSSPVSCPAVSPEKWNGPEAKQLTGEDLAAVARQLITTQEKSSGCNASSLKQSEKSLPLGLIEL